ncbi:MobF family relaxase [Microbacterium sp. NPDC019599]|uniref:MobF family relaxase n=1 Tax=Microbacterium sp. NPDC019599 TaxID=3154690 RepID=UPI0033CCE297
MHKMTSTNGVDYLLRSVAAGDGLRDLGTPLTRYYTEAGTPPGMWLGKGVALLGHDAVGRLAEGDTVTEDALRLLVGEGRDPLTRLLLGKAPATYTKPPRHRAPDGRDTSRGVAGRAERATPTRQAVAGFDFTFSPPKSVSVLWGVADAGTQSLIAAAHHAAVRDIVDALERRVAVTRIGTNGFARVPVQGVVAAAYDHYDSRTGDPQLHTHVVIANHVMGPDGVWRTLFGNPLHKATVALSEMYDAVLMDRLRDVLGVSWALRDKGRDRNAGWEIAGVQSSLIDAFSTRSRGSEDASGIEARKNQLITDYAERYGHQPSSRVAIRLRQQATLDTRPDKTLRSLSELTASWRASATELLGEDATTWARTLLETDATDAVLRADDLTAQVLDDLAVVTRMVVEDKRAVWGRWNLWAEAVRQTKGIRFASALDREMVLDAVVGRAEDASLRLTPQYDRQVPLAFTLPDGSPAFAPREEAAYSSQAILDAEARLLAATSGGGPALEHRHMERFALLPDLNGITLDDDQALAITRIATSGRLLDVLVGPAGAGKTTALRALRAAWESRHGAGSVVGLAPSAAAADVLADSIGIHTENTAKWSFEHAVGRWNLSPGQLVIVDEASLSGTLLLVRLVQHAQDARAKVLLVGDWAQLSAVETGGAFGLVARSIEDAPELTDVRRFRFDWEKTATLGLRTGSSDVLDDYAQHHRIHEAEDPLDLAYRAWRTDQEAGRSTVMIAADATTVGMLGARAQADRVATGEVAADGVPLHDGNCAGTGDDIVTRLNDRRLIAGSGWVKNGDRWRVVRTFDDGSLAVRRLSRGGKLGGAVVLPASYVEANVELGYAITVHRAQGMTVDTAHAIIDGDRATREQLYVAMTRGATANHIYLDSEPGTDHHGDTLPPRSTGARLADVMARVGAEPTATETLRVAVDEHCSLRRLIAEYETIAAHAVSIGAARWPVPGGRDRTTVVGLLTRPTGPFTAEYASALQERELLIADAVRAEAHAAVASRETWTRNVPRSVLETLVAYRAKYDVTGPTALGDPRQITDRTQARDYQRARRAQTAAEAFIPRRRSPESIVASRGGIGR